MIAALLAVLWTLGLLLLIASARRAPVGFEDETGFHAVEQSFAHEPMRAAPVRIG